MDKFAFGENWASYSERLEFQDYLSAKKYLENLIPDIKNKTFLDIGCGSGLHSIAASALGASKVVGLDVDSQCVETSKKLLGKISQQDKDIKKNTIEFEVQSILDQNLSNERFDIVYSWGVLHHTGNMYKAFGVVCNLVKEEGTLVIAIYNKYFTSPLWKAIKYTYVKSPKPVKKILIGLGVIRFSLAALLLTGEIPFHGERGMHFYTDIVDWIGGYPYEYASADEVITFFAEHGFKLRTFIKARGGTGCNQFVFDRIK
jgi:2-polyprenyl-6-hydroxyphenyl methylase/3-demethylubiquinone-9 3-methyltransferase